MRRPASESSRVSRHKVYTPETSPPRANQPFFLLAPPHWPTHHGILSFVHVISREMETLEPGDKTRRGSRMRTQSRGPRRDAPGGAGSAVHGVFVCLFVCLLESVCVCTIKAPKRMYQPYSEAQWTKSSNNTMTPALLLRHTACKHKL